MMPKYAWAGLLKGTLLVGTAWVFATPAIAVGEPAQAAPDGAKREVGNGAQAEALATNDIIVTARRKSERLSDVPASITVLSTDELKSKGISNPTDLIHAIPSLQQSGSSFGNAEPHFLIRGQRQQLQFMQNDQSVGVYVDEIALPRNVGLNGALFDLASVQVLKGPQGTLFGKNQAGGAILFTSQMPKPEFGGYFSLTLGNYDARKIEGATNIPISDELRIRLAGQINRRDGYMHNVTDNRDYDDAHSDAWRVSAYYGPNAVPIKNWLIVSGLTENEIGVGLKQTVETLDLPGVGTSTLFRALSGGANTVGDPLLSAAIQSQSRSYGPLEFGGVSQFQRPDGNNIEIKNFAVTNKTELSLNDNMTLRNISGYRFLSSYTSASSGGISGILLQPGTTAVTAGNPNTILANPAGNVVCGPQSGINCVLSTPIQSLVFIRQRQVSDEVNFLGKEFNGKLDYILGAYYFREHGTELTPTFTTISTGNRFAVSQNQPANASKAIFGQATYRPIHDVAVTVGLRQTWDQRETNSRSVTLLTNYFPFTGGLIPADGVVGQCALVGNSGTLPNNTPSNPDNCLFSGKVNFKKLTYTASVDWHPTVDTLLYVTSRKGYRSGGFNQSATVNTTVNPTVLTPFKPETVIDYEVGFKGNWRWDNGMAGGLNIAAYRSNYNNIQRALTAAAGNKLITANAATAKISGVEVEARFEPVKWVRMSGYYSYIDARFKSFVVSDPVLFAASALGNFTNAAFSGVPTHSGGATIALQTELSEGRGRLTGGFDYYGQTGTFKQDNNLVAATGQFIEADRIPGYWLLGANISWSNVMGKPIDLAFNVRNLNNKRYYTGGVDGSTSGLGIDTFLVGEPRMYTFSLVYHF